jgi:hypothetical protein
VPPEKAIGRLLIHFKVVSRLLYFFINHYPYSSGQFRLLAASLIIGRRYYELLFQFDPLNEDTKKQNAFSDERFSHIASELLRRCQSALW